MADKRERPPPSTTGPEEDDDVLASYRNTFVAAAFKHDLWQREGDTNQNGGISQAALISTARPPTPALFPNVEKLLVMLAR